MAVDFFESPAFSPSWSHEENSLAAEITYNGDLINWDYWAGLSNISPEQAAKLCWAIDPIKWSANSYALGDVPNELSEKIQRLEQWLKSRFSSLSLSDLIDAVGKDKAPTGMIEAVESKSIDEAKKHSSDIQPLEQLTKEERSNYNSRAAWTWVDAIYILQGYKPAYQLSTEQVRSHFPDWVKYFTDSLLLGTVGKETMQAGQRIFIDSPANWQAFWQIIHKTPEPKAEAVEKLSLDNELDTILDIGLHDAFNELKQRNEAPYDGVLGCPPDSITENEKERFESIRNRLLVGECFTDAYIRGLINDCDSNTHSFSLIPDGLKQDIRFLASLWRAAKQDKPKAKAIEDDGLNSKENTNDIAASSLLKLPARQDAWVDVISDMAKAFYDEFSKLPNESQAWGQLWINPPAGNVIETGKDKGEDCLNMPGAKPLSKSGFSKRWKSYTGNNTQ